MANVSKSFLKEYHKSRSVLLIPLWRLCLLFETFFSCNFYGFCKLVRKSSRQTHFFLQMPAFSFLPYHCCYLPPFLKISGQDLRNLECRIYEEPTSLLEFRLCGFSKKVYELLFSLFYHIRHQVLFCRNHHHLGIQSRASKNLFSGLSSKTLFPMGKYSFFELLLKRA